MKHLIHKPVTTYKVEMFNRSDFRKLGGFKPKTYSEAKKLTNHILNSGFDADVSVYKKGKFAYKENPEDFAAGRK
jgi:hypothetical protein